MILKNCRVCGSNKLKKVFSLGNQPLANNLENKITKSNKYPLELNLCKSCFNCQLSISVSSIKLFNKYLYKSSISKNFILHFSNAAIKYIKNFKLNKNSFILDIGSNDGIGLNSYKKQKFINLFGIEPATNLANITKKLGIKTYNAFLNKNLSNKLKDKFHLITASNVFAHVSNIKQFTVCVEKMLKKDGIFIIEVQYLYRMLKDLSFDNIYHEHVNYWSVNSLNTFLSKMNMKIFNVEEINTHGGSIRIYVKKENNKKIKISRSVKKFINKENKYEINNIQTYKIFEKKVLLKRKMTIKKLSKIHSSKKKVVGFGAPAKATTLINFYKLHKFIDYIIDDNIIKKNKFIPNTKIQILNKPKKEKIDYIVVFACNYFNEIKKNNYKITKSFINIFKP